MSDSCPVVRITADNEQGFIVINESDLKSEHDLFVEPSNNAPKEGSKEWICAKLEDAGIAHDKTAIKADLKAQLDALGG